MNKGILRDSNLELMRIVLMLSIIAHHSVVNSDVMDLWKLSDISIGGVPDRLGYVGQGGY